MIDSKKKVKSKRTKFVDEDITVPVSDKKAVNKSIPNTNVDFGLEPDFEYQPEVVESNDVSVERISDKKTDKDSSTYKQAPSGVKKKKKKHNFKRRKITEDPSVVNCTTLSNSEDFLKIYQKFLIEQNLSNIEADELNFEQNHFRDVETRGKGQDIAQFLTDGLNWSPGVCQRCEKSSQVVIVCSAAMRCIELINALKASEVQRRAYVSKMFSSHMKIGDQAKELGKNAVHVCVGTPARLAKLVEEKHLHLDACKYLIIDFNWRNSKLKRIVDIPETKSELMKFLFVFKKKFDETKNTLVVF